MTDKDLLQARSYAVGVVNYKKDFELFDDALDLGYGVAVDLALRVRKLAPGFKEITDKMGIEVPELEEEIGDLFELNDPEAIQADGIITNIDGEIKRRKESPFAGPDDLGSDSGRIASDYDGDPTNDGTDPNISLYDAREMYRTRSDVDPTPGSTPPGEVQPSGGATGDRYGDRSGGEENPSYGSSNRPSAPTFDENEYVDTHPTSTGGSRKTSKPEGGGEGYVHEITSPTGQSVTYTESTITTNEDGEVITGGADLPVLIDLDGDGVEIDVSGDVSFDIDGDGYLEQTAWVDADDGFLVIDLNADGTRGAGDGIIDQSKELVLGDLWGVQFSTDLQVLAQFDKAGFGGNGNGRLDGGDDIWDELRIWQDANQNGISDDGEVKTLRQMGFNWIGLTYDDGTGYADTSNDRTFLGTTVLGSSSYQRNGSKVTGGVGDVALANSILGWRPVETERGFNIEFETGQVTRYGVMDGTGAAHWDVNARNFDVVVGDARGNELIATGQTRGVSISGGSGNDIVRGGAGDDLLSGDAGWDRISGGDGNDTIFFDAADKNYIYGGAGYDVAYAVGETGVTLSLSDRAFEAAYGSEGHDTLDASGLGSSTTLHGRGGNDTLTGGTSGDLLSGDDGKDVLVGGAGGDMMLGGLWTDTLSGGDGDDKLFGGKDADTLNGQGGDDTLFGGNGVDTLDGGARDDYLDGGDQNDTLSGGEGDDTLFGGQGNDTLHGDDGDDFLSGGNGDDTVYTGKGDDTVETGSGEDTVHVEGVGDKTVETGIKDDEIHVSHAKGSHDISGGDGVDKLYLTKGRSDYRVIELRGVVPELSPIKGYRVEYLDSNNNVYQRVDLVGIEQIVYGDGKKKKLVATDGEIQDLWNVSFQGDPVDHYIEFGGSANSNSWTGIGNDYLRADGLNGAGADNIRMQSGDDTLDLVGGNDIGDGGSGDDTINGEGGNDTLYGQSGSDGLNGGNGADTLEGGTGADLLQGGKGNDSLTGGAGADVIYGDAGNDIIWGSSGADIVEAGDGADTLHGGTGRDSLGGGSGNDTLYGGDGADRLFGDGNDDKLYGENGDDSLDGGDGNDTLEGGGDNDRLDGGKGVDTLKGGEGFDTLTGGDGNDSLWGGALDDSLFGGADVDYLDGGSGNDYLEGGAGADTIKGQGGVRDVVGYTQSAQAVGINLGAGTAWGGEATGDKLSGAEGIVGSAFNDTIVGDGADNQLYGGQGNDYLKGWSGRDELHGDDGTDTLTGDNGDDTLFGGAGNDTLWGNNDDDVLSGGDGNDHLYGGNHKDRLLGGNGNDTLVGGHGRDELTGGDGWDKFVFTQALEPGQVDTITDFNPKYDEFHLESDIFRQLDLGEIDHTQFKIGPEATDAAHRIIYKKGTGEVFYDRDGNGSAEAKLFAQVEEGTELTKWDFLVF